MIRVVNVVQHYGIRPVLRGVSLEIKKGDVIALMGPNGMGKSSLMGVIAGTIAPLEGYVEIDGKRRRRSKEEELAIRRQTVYLPAEPWLPTALTGREWMLQVGRLYQVPEERLMSHLERLLMVFNLEKQADSAIGSYSSGQRKKIALCCALITDAPVMLLDEPFSGGLDPSAILALKRILAKLRERDDVTVVMATPVPEQVEELADRVAIIVDGKLSVYDTLEALRARTGLKSLDDMYEQIASPQTAQNIDRYFEGVVK